ncbi:hypothetical protein CU044_5316 [Streptomyces sp. L-9-10]|nr:hypothetical protein CU044_5316 [Streptomyces sp. L-9-10]
MQPHTRPRERQPAGSVGVAHQPNGVQRRVQQCRVQTESVRPHPVRQGHLGEHLVPAAPQRPQALEHRPVAETARGHTVVVAVQVHGLGARRRPLDQDGLDGPAALAQHTGGVPGPRAAVLRVTRTGVEGQFAPARRVLGTDPYLYPHRAVLGQDERRFQRQFLDQVAADLVTRAHRQLDERRTGQQHRTHDRVVGEPRVGLDRQATGEQHTVHATEGDGGAQQRMLGGTEPGRGDVTGLRHGVEPVALALERVRRQVQPPGATAVEEGLPVHPDTAYVQLPRGRGGGHRLGPVTAQHRHEDRVRRGLLTQRRQRPARTDLDERAHTLAHERADGVGEPYGLAYVPHPVLRRRQLLRARPRTGQRRHDRDGRRLEGHRLQHPAELTEHRFHQGRVERMAHPQPGHLPPRVTPALSDRLHIGGDTGDDHRRRTVHRRDTHGLRQLRRDLGLGRLDRHHRTALGQRLHQRTTRRHHLHGVSQRPHTRHVGGGQLTDRVPGQHIRPHTPRLQQTEQRHLDREQRRLRHPRLVQRVGILAPQDLTHPRIELTQDLVQGFREHRETGGQFTAHPELLRPLTREQETHLAGFVGDSPDHGATRPALGHGRQSGQELGPVGGDQHRTVFQYRP